MIDVQVDEAYASEVDSELIERAVQAVLRNEEVTGEVGVSILVTNDEELHRLNREFRGVDAPTDVLSFGNDGDDTTTFVYAPNTPRYLGDIAVSYERVIAQADEYGHSVQRELAYLVAHGVLHLLGYDHERGPEDAAEMRQREEAAMTVLGLTR
jgi:probable rRNA maturation factor